MAKEKKNSKAVLKKFYLIEKERRQKVEIRLKNLEERYCNIKDNLAKINEIMKTLDNY
jgi:hypothetical protein